MSEQLKRFVSLLRQIFELDKADIQRETEHTTPNWVYIRIN